MRPWGPDHYRQSESSNDKAYFRLSLLLSMNRRTVGGRIKTFIAYDVASQRIYERSELSASFSIRRTWFRGGDGRCLALQCASLLVWSFAYSSRRCSPRARASQHDYIIAGECTGGLVIANQLSEDASAIVIVIEPGTDQKNNLLLSHPTKFGQSFGTPCCFSLKHKTEDNYIYKYTLVNYL